MCTGKTTCEDPDAGICPDGRVDQPLSRRLHYSRLQWKFHVSAHISFKRPPEADSSRRLLVSQDRHEVFLTLATFNKDYVEYVLGNLNAEVKSSKGSTSGPFLRMNEVGPFITTNKSHMKCLGYYVLAFTLQECGDAWVRRRGAR